MSEHADAAERRGDRDLHALLLLHLAPRPPLRLGLQEVPCSPCHPCSSPSRWRDLLNHRWQPSVIAFDRLPANDRSSAPPFAAFVDHSYFAPRRVTLLYPWRVPAQQLVWDRAIASPRLTQLFLQGLRMSTWLIERFVWVLRRQLKIWAPYCRGSTHCLRCASWSCRISQGKRECRSRRLRCAGGRSARSCAWHTSRRPTLGITWAGAIIGLRRSYAPFRLHQMRCWTRGRVVAEIGSYIVRIHAHASSATLLSRLLSLASVLWRCM